MKQSVAFLAALLMASSSWADEQETSTVNTVSETAEAAQAETSTYPISASVSLGYRFNHANFADTEDDDLQYGWQLLTLKGLVAYNFTKEISAYAAFAVDKALSEGYYRAPVAGGASSRTLRQTELHDINLGAAWNFLNIDAAHLSFAGVLDIAIPTSKASQAAGLILSVSPSVSMAWNFKGFSAAAGFAYSYNVNQDPTQQIDCERFPDLCRIHGEDAGQPNALQSIAGNFGIAYTFLDQLTPSFSYSLSNGYQAVKFPHDEYSSPYAQNDSQKGLGMHSTSFALSWKFLKNSSASIYMTTVRSLYTEDGKNVTQPFFDTDSNINHRTSYGVTLTQSF